MGQENCGRTHGYSYSITYSSWKCAKTRCRNPKNAQYSDYGGRGIEFSITWEKFEDFLRDMGERPSKKYSLDRIDVNGNYEPGNCRWVKMKTQLRNKRNNRIIEYNGKSQCLADWADEIGIDLDILWARINKYGWTIEETLTKPVGNPRGKSRRYAEQYSHSD